MTAYAVGTNDFPHRSSLIIGGIEVITGMGMVLGPLVAGTIKANFGFGFMFGGIGVSIIIISLVLLCFFPKVKSVQDKDEDNDDF